MNLSDIILQQVTKNVAGSNIQIPANVQQQVLGGLSDSILGSLTKTATAPGGIDLIKNLLTGQADAATSPVTALAGNLFTKNILSKLNLGSVLSGGLLALIPKIFGGLKGIIKDQDGDGDVDLQDILIVLKGGKGNGLGGLGGSVLGSVLGGALGGNSTATTQKTSNAGGSVLGSIAGSVLGGILGKKK